MAQRKRQKKEKANKQLAKLLGEHLSKFTPAERNAMHQKFEKRLASLRDSAAKTLSHSRAEIR
jgi:uncharacterized protein (DUF885 family)